MWALHAQQSSEATGKNSSEKRNCCARFKFQSLHFTEVMRCCTCTSSSTIWRVSQNSCPSCAALMSVTNPHHVMQLVCHSWKEWLYLLCSQELVTGERPWAICLLSKMQGCLLPLSLGLACAVSWPRLNFSSRYFFWASVNRVDFFAVSV